MRILVWLLLGGCFSAHEPSHDWSSDAGVDAPCGTRLLSTRELLSETYHVVRGTCAGRVSEVTLRFRGSSSGRVEIVEAIPDYADYLEVRPEEVSRVVCRIDGTSRYRVSRTGGLEVDAYCDDEIARRIDLRVYQTCEQLTVEIEAFPSEPLQVWVDGCYGGDWSRR